MIKNGTILKPFPKSCLPGITRELVFKICEKNNIPLFEQDISITQLYNADEVFTTGTMGELARVVEIDKRKIETKNKMLLRVQKLFKKLTELEGEKLPF